MGARRYRDRNGIVGIGFEIEFAGIPMVGIAWPDRPPSRHARNEFENGLITDLGEGSTLPVAPDPGEDLESKILFLEDLNSQLQEQYAKLTEENKHLREVAELFKSEILEVKNTQSVPLSTEVTPAAKPHKSEAEHIRDYVTANPSASNAQVIEHLATINVAVTSSQIAYQRKRMSEKA